MLVPGLSYVTRNEFGVGLFFAQRVSIPGRLYFGDVMRRSKSKIQLTDFLILFFFLFIASCAAAQAAVPPTKVVV